jgi:hypothetical protein
VGLSRYPVKSMGVESLDSADVSWHGVVGDRRWAFVRAGVERSGCAGVYGSTVEQGRVAVGDVVYLGR